MKTYHTRLYQLSLFLIGFVLIPSAWAATFTVNSTNDANDLVCDATHCSLREAINAVNTSCAGNDEIKFNIPTSNASSGAINYYSIKPATPLPIIQCKVNIDGYTQPGANPGAPLVELSGENILANFTPTASSYPAGLLFVGRDRVTGAKLAINPDNSTVRGLMINKFPRHGIYLYGTDGVTVIGNYFALDVTGEKAGYSNMRFTPAVGLYGEDLKLEASSYTYIGTTATDYPDTIAPNGVNRNLFGSSARVAIVMDALNTGANGYGLCSGACVHNEFGSHHNVVQGNYIGLNKEGNCAIGGFRPNSLTAGDPGNCNSDGSRSSGPDPLAVYSTRGDFGVVLQTVPASTNVTSNNNINNVLGGLKPGQGNVIVASKLSGIRVISHANQILGNIMGLNAAGTNNTTNITPFSRASVFLESFGNLVEGNTFANSKSASSLDEGLGLYIGTAGGSDVGFSDDLPPNIIRNNFIGTNAAGAKNIGNKGPGVFIIWRWPTRIENNVIAYNGAEPKTNFAIGAPGVYVRPTYFPNTATGAVMGTNNRVSIVNNKIYCNGIPDPTDPIDPQCGRWIGIDLAPNPPIPTPPVVVNGTADGPTLNDPQDTDIGSNELLNFPVLDAKRSIVNPALIIAEGVFNSVPNQQYLLQFFSNRDDALRCIDKTVVPPVGYQPNCPVITSTAFLGSQGEVLVGEVKVTTNSSGNASFRVVSNMDVPVGSVITATATRLQALSDATVNYPAGAPLYTSEFSQAIDVDAKGSANAYIHANGAAGGDGGQETLTPSTDEE